MSTLRRSRKLLLGLSGVAIAGSMAGLGTFASFTSSTSASNTIATGTVVVALSSAGVDNRLNVSASGLVPGDSVQRRVKLTNTGTQGFASVVLTTTAPTSSLLDTDATNGLQMKIEKCGGALGWTESVSTPYTYTCDTAVPTDNTGTRSAVLVERQVVGSSLALAGLSSLTAGSTDDMVVSMRLPSGAGNTFQNITSTISYVFDAAQRTSTNK